MIFRLVHDVSRQRAIEAVKAAPMGHVVEIKEETRNLEQNARLHSLLSDIVKAQTLWAGKTWDIDGWKSLMIHGVDTLNGHPGNAAPGLEGGIALVRRSTARMSKRELSELIDYIESWMVSHSIPIRDKHAA